MKIPPNIKPGAQCTARILWVSPYSRSWWIRKPKDRPTVKMAQVPVPRGVTLAQLKRAIAELGKPDIGRMEYTGPLP